MNGQAWFSALGEPLGDEARAEIVAYLVGLAMTARVHAVSSWEEAAAICAAAGAASYAAYQARLARAARAAPGHTFLRKYALYCAGRWPLGVYDERFAIF